MCVCKIATETGIGRSSVSDTHYPQRSQAQVPEGKVSSTTNGRESAKSSRALAGATGQILRTRGRVYFFTDEK